MLAFIQSLLGLMFLDMSGGELLIISLFGLPWLFAFIDILKHEFSGNNKLIWLIVIIFVPFFGAIAYLIIGRNQRINL